MRATRQQVTTFLAGRFGTIDEVQGLGGGDWSHAYAFDTAERALVARFGRYGEDFAKDRAAHRVRPPSARRD
jgi:hypothetical protein